MTRTIPQPLPKTQLAADPPPLVSPAHLKLVPMQTVVPLIQQIYPTDSLRTHILIYEY